MEDEERQESKVDLAHSDDRMVAVAPEVGTGGVEEDRVDDGDDDV